MKKRLCLLFVLMIAVGASACAKPADVRQTSAPAVETAVSTAPDSAKFGDKLSVHFIDVGQGDATLLESDGEYVLIDAGERDCGDKVLRYIKDQGADELKYVIATHPHTDHIGGMKTVLEGIETENFITVETDCATKTWTKVLETVDRLDIDYLDAQVGDSYDFGEATFTVMAPYSDSYSGYNDYSVVTKVVCGDIRFMLTGDAEKASEYEMAASGADLSADVLKCGHHGSSTSTTAKFLKAVDPAYAVISCGKDNDYGHPHKETLQKLGILGCELYRTDQMGTIVAHTDGKSLRFDTETNAVTYSYATEKSDTQGGENYYIGNKNSHIFHRPSCESVEAMSEKNKIKLSSREEAISGGYTPCGSCDP